MPQLRPSSVPQQHCLFQSTCTMSVSSSHRTCHFPLQYHTCVTSADANRQHTCMKATQRQSRLGTDIRSSSRRLCRCQTRISPSPHAANTSLYSYGNATSWTLLGGELCSISACSFLLCRPSPICVLHQYCFNDSLAHTHHTGPAHGKVWGTCSRLLCTQECTSR